MHFLRAIYPSIWVCFPANLGLWVHGLMHSVLGCHKEGTGFEANRQNNLGHCVCVTEYVLLFNHKKDPLKFIQCWVESNPRFIYFRQLSEHIFTNALDTDLMAALLDT